MNGFALGLCLKRRPRATRKWAVIGLRKEMTKTSLNLPLLTATGHGLCFH